MTLFLLLSMTISFAQTYPSTCPSEAIGILEAVGGCDAVDCDRFPAICEKCCVKAITPIAAPIREIQPSYTSPQSSNGIIIVVVIAALIISFVIWFLKGKFTQISKKSKTKVLLS